MQPVKILTRSQFSCEKDFSVSL